MNQKKEEKKEAKKGAELMMELHFVIYQVIDTFSIRKWKLHPPHSLIHFSSFPSWWRQWSS